MRGDHVVLRAAAAWCAPLMVLFALALLAEAPAGAGVGFTAGLALALPLTLFVLVFGAAELRRAFPPLLARGALALGLVLTLVGAAGPRLLYAAQIIEAGALLTTLGGVALLLTVLAGRAPILRDEQW